MRLLKQTFVALLLAMFFATTTLFAASRKKEDIVKTGMNYAIFPVVNYNTDLGFQFGAMGQMFYYGDGSSYPNYLHKWSVFVGFYTKGAKQLDFSYDSKYLIPRKRITANVQYFDSPLNGFFGFNGAVSPYYCELNQMKSENSEDGIAFYSNHQRLFNFLVDLQGRIMDKMTWLAGVSLSHHNYSTVSLKCYQGEESLYYQYLENGLIPSQDTHGIRAEVKSGVIYDTRDFEPNPTKGLVASANISPGASFSDGKMRGSIMLSVGFNQYIGIIPSRLVFAYQLSYDGIVAGSLPFYRLPAFSMRGCFGRRIVGNGIARVCSDLRFTAFRFNLFKQNIEIGLIGFAEAGAVVQPYKLPQQRLLGDITFSKVIDETQYGPYKTIYDPAVGADKEKIHSCMGGGFFFSINKNFLASVQFSHPNRIQDGGNGLYLSLGFAF